jgi:ABC-type Fe3+/spermidine/putrescine transport system ATPase subunit
MSPTQAPPLLVVSNVAITYGGVTAVRPSSFHVGEGEFVTLLGPSGSGKTSLLRAIAGFLQPTSGSLLLRGRPLNGIPAYRRNIGLVFQSYALFPHMTVGENIAFGLKQRKMPEPQIRERIAEVLSYVRLQGLERRRSYELSGGQQQRVAIARALAIRPDLLLLDEPMSNLDALLRTSMQAELRGMLREAGVTAIYVTHNQEEALSMSDRIVVMASGEIRQIGTPVEVYERPADTFVAGFIGMSNLFQARVVSREGDASLARAASGFTVRLPRPTSDGEVTLMVRPERISAGAGAPDGPNMAQGTITDISYLGDRRLLRVRIGNEDFSVSQAAGTAASERGQTVTLSWPDNALVEVGAA